MAVLPDTRQGLRLCQSPYAPPVTLAARNRTQLESLARAHATPQALAFRCRLILRAASLRAPVESPAGRRDAL